MRCLLVFIALLVTVGAASVRAADEEHFEKQLAADPHGSVEISNVSGKIQVSGWDSPQVQVRATLGSSEHIDMDSDRGRISIKVRYPGSSFSGDSTDVQVHVPRESEVSISGISSEVRAMDLSGPLRVRTVSGDVTADVSHSDVEIKTVSGGIALTGKGSEAGGQLRLQSISGGISVDHIAGDLEATTVSGTLKANLESSRNVRIHTTSGGVRFGGKLQKSGIAEVETVSGDLQVHAVPDGALQYEVSSFSGNIKNCMGAPVEKVSQYGPGTRLNGVQGEEGQGEARIRVKSMSGNIELCDKP